MPRGNPENLKPFEKGHKKMGGRKPGVPNKFTRDLKNAIINAAEHVGLDGKGFGGLTGYLTRIAIMHPTSFASFLGRLLPMQEDPAPTEYDLSKLTDDDLDVMQRLYDKIYSSVSSPDNAASLRPVHDDDDDDGQYEERIAELLQIKPAKKRRNATNAGGN